MCEVYKTMDVQKMFLTTVMLVYLTCILHVKAQTAERVIDICHRMSDERARLVHLYNPSFPDTPAESRHCNCTFTSSDQKNLAVSIRFYMTSSFTSLIVKYETADGYNTWTGYSSNFSSRDYDGGFLISDSTSVVEVIYKTTPAFKNVFALDIRAVNMSDELKITCSQLPVTLDESTTGNPNGIVEEIGSLCNAFILIILGSVCTAFFLIIIVLAICLCCTVRKSKSVNMRHSSGTSQPLSNQSSLGLPMESYRVASRLYDDGSAYRTSMNGDQLAVPRHHSLPALRESVGYVNAQTLHAECDAADVNIYGNT